MIVVSSWVRIYHSMQLYKLCRTRFSATNAGRWDLVTERTSDRQVSTPSPVLSILLQLPPTNTTRFRTPVNNIKPTQNSTTYHPSAPVSWQLCFWHLCRLERVGVTRKGAIWGDVGDSKRCNPVTRCEGCRSREGQISEYSSLAGIAVARLGFSSTWACPLTSALQF